MSEAEPRRGSLQFTGPRAEFASSLGRRLDALRAALQALQAEPGDRGRRDNLLRRAHALASAARVLGFAGLSEALGQIECVLLRSDRGRVGDDDLLEVSRVLEILPSLVAGIASRADSPDLSPDEIAEPRKWPLHVLLFGDAAFGATFAAGQPSDLDSMEHELTSNSTRALELARTVGPDVILIDGDHESAFEVVTQLSADSWVDTIPRVVIGTFTSPETAAKFVSRGASRVLPKPVGPETLHRVVAELGRRETSVTGFQPLGEMTVVALAERISAEFQRGLVEATDSGGRVASVPLGDGADVMAAVWGALSRVRELVTLRSEGSVRFDPTGPEGAIPVAPWTGVERRAGQRRSSHRGDNSDVSLRGRTVIVADDDPAITWFLSAVLKAVGMNVHEAHDGASALKLSRKTWPDLIISDVLMPELDGFSLCREIKRDVAIRDLPVILLSWKEDLLQRVRELGAEADGYLRKEAAAATVLDRVREVLLPRARVEGRLSAGGDVQGRLDGLTPRLLLDLCCRDKRDRCLTIRDAVHQYEVQIRGGRLRVVVQTGLDGTTVRGAAALSALLGVNAGRFAASEDHSPCREAWQAGLNELLAEPIGRARRMAELVSQAVLARVQRIEFAPGAQDWLSATPTPVRDVLRDLIAGRGPSELLAQGVEPRLLQAVIDDQVRRGLVEAVHTGPPDSDGPRPESARSESGLKAIALETGLGVQAQSGGSKILNFSAEEGERAEGLPSQGARASPSQEASEPEEQPPFSGHSRASSGKQESELLPHPEVSVQSHADNTASELLALPDDDQNAPQFSFLLSPEPPKVEPKVAGETAEDIFVMPGLDLEGEPDWTKEPGTLPGLGHAVSAQPQAARIDSIHEAETRTPPPATVERIALDLPDKGRHESAASEAESAAESGAVEGGAAQGGVVGSEAGKVEAAESEAVESEAAEDGAIRSGAIKGEAAEGAGAPAPILPVAKKIVFPSRPRATKASDSSLPPIKQGLKRALKAQAASAPPAVEPTVSAEPAPRVVEPIASALPAPPPAEPSAGAAPVLPVVAPIAFAPPAPLVAEPSASAPRMPPAEPVVVAPPVVKPIAAPAPIVEPQAAAPVATEPAPAPMVAAPVVTTPVAPEPRLGPPPLQAFEAGPEVPEQPPKTEPLPHQEPEQSPALKARLELAAEDANGFDDGAEPKIDEPAHDEATVSVSAGDGPRALLVNALKTGGMAVAAAGIAFVATQWALGSAADKSAPNDSTEPQAASEVTAQTAAALAKPAKPAKPAETEKAEPQPKLEVLALPDGIELEQGGLLEVVTPGRQMIYVDGVFVGRGPIRRIELDAGEHRFTIKLEGEPKREYTARVERAKRTRVELPKP